MSSNVEVTGDAGAFKISERDGQLYAHHPASGITQLVGALAPGRWLCKAGGDAITIVYPAKRGRTAPAPAPPAPAPPAEHEKSARGSSRKAARRKRSEPDE